MLDWKQQETDSINYDTPRPRNTVQWRRGRARGEGEERRRSNSNSSSLSISTNVGKFPQYILRWESKSQNRIFSVACPQTSSMCYILCVHIRIENKSPREQFKPLTVDNFKEWESNFTFYFNFIQFNFLKSNIYLLLNFLPCNIVIIQGMNSKSPVFFTTTPSKISLPSQSHLGDTPEISAIPIKS